MLYSSLTFTGKSGDQWAIELSDGSGTCGHNSCLILNRGERK